MRWAQQIWHGVKDEFSDLPDLDSLTRLVLRLALAAVAGGVVGWERQRAGKDAGVRTHMLVSIAAALFVLVPEQEGATPSDLTRVIQGVAAGVGFLGVGLIFRPEGEKVRGLTSAAGIWLTAALGVAAGLGRAASAATSTLMAVVILRLLRAVEQRTERRRGPTSNAGAPPATDPGRRA